MADKQQVLLQRMTLAVQSAHNAMTVLKSENERLQKENEALKQEVETLKAAINTQSTSSEAAESQEKETQKLARGSEKQSLTKSTSKVAAAPKKATTAHWGIANDAPIRFQIAETKDTEKATNSLGAKTNAVGATTVPAVAAPTTNDVASTTVAVGASTIAVGATAIESAKISPPTPNPKVETRKPQQSMAVLRNQVSKRLGLKVLDMKTRNRKQASPAAEIKLCLSQLSSENYHSVADTVLQWPASDVARGFYLVIQRFAKNRLQFNWSVDVLERSMSVNSYYVGLLESFVLDLFSKGGRHGDVFVAIMRLLQALHHGRLLTMDVSLPSHDLQVGRPTVRNTQWLDRLLRARVNRFGSSSNKPTQTNGEHNGGATGRIARVPRRLSQDDDDDETDEEVQREASDDECLSDSHYVDISGSDSDSEVGAYATVAAVARQSPVQQPDSHTTEAFDDEDEDGDVSQATVKQNHTADPVIAKPNTSVRSLLDKVLGDDLSSDSSDDDDDRDQVPVARDDQQIAATPSETINTIVSELDSIMPTLLEKYEEHEAVHFVIIYLLLSVSYSSQWWDLYDEVVAAMGQLTSLPLAADVFAVYMLRSRHTLKQQSLNALLQTMRSASDDLDAGIAALHAQRQTQLQSTSDSTEVVIQEKVNQLTVALQDQLLSVWRLVPVDAPSSVLTDTSITTRDHRRQLQQRGLWLALAQLLNNDDVHQPSGSAAMRCLLGMSGYKSSTICVQIHEALKRRTPWLRSLVDSDAGTVSYDPWLADLLSNYGCSEIKYDEVFSTQQHDNYQQQQRDDTRDYWRRLLQTQDDSTSDVISSVVRQLQVFRGQIVPLITTLYDAYQGAWRVAAQSGFSYQLDAMLQNCIVQLIQKVEAFAASVAIMPFSASRDAASSSSSSSQNDLIANGVAVLQYCDMFVFNPLQVDPSDLSPEQHRQYLRVEDMVVSVLDLLSIRQLESWLTTWRLSVAEFVKFCGEYSSFASNPAVVALVRELVQLWVLPASVSGGRSLPHPWNTAVDLDMQYQAHALLRSMQRSITSSSLSSASVVDVLVQQAEYLDHVVPCYLLSTSSSSSSSVTIVDSESRFLHRAHYANLLVHRVSVVNEDSRFLTQVAETWNTVIPARFTGRLPITAKPLTAAERTSTATHLMLWTSMARLHTARQRGMLSSEDVDHNIMAPSEWLHFNRPTSRFVNATPAPPRLPGQASSSAADSTEQGIPDFHIVFSEGSQLRAHGDLAESIFHAVRRLPADWDVLFLHGTLPRSHAMFREFHRLPGHYLQVNYVQDCSAYVLSERAAVKILQQHLPVNAPVHDFLAGLVFQGDFKGFVLADPTAVVASEQQKRKQGMKRKRA